MVSINDHAWAQLSCFKSADGQQQMQLRYLVQDESQLRLQKICFKSLPEPNTDHIDQVPVQRISIRAFNHTISILATPYVADAWKMSLYFHNPCILGLQKKSFKYCARWNGSKNTSCFGIIGCSAGTVYEVSQVTPIRYIIKHMSVPDHYYYI